MPDTKVAAGVLFHVSPKDTEEKNFLINGLNADSIVFEAVNSDSETVSFTISFTVSKAYLTKEDIILQRENTKDLAHLPFDKDDEDKRVIAINTLDVLLSQGKASDPVVMTISALLPFSKVGGAPVKVGGAPEKVGGAGL